MAETQILGRSELDELTPTPALFDALIAEDGVALIFSKTLTAADPGISQQRTTPNWPHHLPGDVIIFLTGQAAAVAMRRQGLIDARWRGHGVRIQDARFSAPVFVGERFFTRVEVIRVRRLRSSLHVRFGFRMWKLSPTGEEIETYRSQQDAIFSPG